jgi:hypothetical protein
MPRPEQHNSPEFPTRQGHAILPAIAVALLLLFPTLARCAPQTDTGSVANSDPFGWNNIEPAARPRAFWWWLGSSVSKPEIDRQLQSLKNAGFGGLLVCPLYEYSNPVLPSIKYLSTDWVDMFKYCCDRGRELGISIDMTVGGGWPMGGPWVTKNNGERYLRLEKRHVVVRPGHRLDLSDENGKDPIACVSYLKSMDLPAPGPATVITPKNLGHGQVWQVPEGTWDVLISRMGYTRFDVYVAGPGGVGPVFDFWSAEAFTNLVEPFSGLLRELGTSRPTYTFCDSYEGRGGSTPGMFRAFTEANGYDLRPFLHQLLKENDSPENRRIWHDHRYAISRMHVGFTRRWTQWAHQQGVQTMYQWIGDPANPLDTCAEVDLPDAAPSAVSAAHIMGKRLVSNETFTWGAGHDFNGSLDYFRKAADSRSGVMGGVNMAVYHGVPFTPLAEPWPGPMYYAGANFSETQPWFRHVSHLNTYLARLQQTLQHTRPDVEVLILSSMHDCWLGHNTNGWQAGQPLVWRNSEHPGEGGVAIAATLGALLDSQGIQADFCSDKLLQEVVRAKGGRLVTPGTSYKVLIIPPLGCVEPETIRQLEQLAAGGCTLLFIGPIPRSIPKRLPLVQDTSGSTNRLHQLILARAAPHSDAAAPVYQLNDSSSDALTRFLISKGVQPDGLPGRLAMLRATHGQDPLYFFKNESGDQKVDAWVPLQHKAKHAVIGNARTGSIGLAQSKPSTNGTSVHLVLEPTEVLVVRLTDQPVSTLKQLNPSQTPARTEIVKGPWALSWTDYQGASHGSSINELASWTQLAGLELYSGSVGYETSLVVKPEELSGLCELDLGAVHESADVWVNGEHAGCIWTTPYRLDITRHLHPGRNTLRLNVVNLAQNRIIDMQRNHIPWQKCRLEENDFQGYCGQLRLDKLTPLKSGLLGPVKLLKHPRS